jgi:hypothetical protein
VAGEGEAVGEGLGALHEGFGDAIGDDHRAHRRVGGGQRLGQGDDVGLVAEAFAAEPVAERPQAQITSSEIISTS